MQFVQSNWEGIILVLTSAVALASASMLTVLVKGKSLKKAIKIKEKDIIDALGGLSNYNKNSIKLVINGLRAAVKNYHENNSLNI